MGGHVWKEGGDARPSNEDEKCGRGDRVQNDVVLRNIGGGRGGSGSVDKCCVRGPAYVVPPGLLGRVQ